MHEIQRTILHPTSASPDPTYDRRLAVDADGWARFDLHPAHCSHDVGFAPESIQVDRDRSRPLEPLVVANAAGEHAEIVLDFGTELEAELEVRIEAPGPCNVYATFGESAFEALGLCGYGQGKWCQVQHWFTDGTGARRYRFPAVGFRYVRLQVHDCPPGSRVLAAVAHAVTVGSEQLGDVHVPEDPLLQRLWQTSLYTARCCTRPDDLWDGIKRDRMGWYGDARITQLALDSGFMLAEPAAAMLARVPTDEWVNGIPNFSFDGVMMLRDLIGVHGVDGVPGCRDLTARVDAMLGWVARSQCTSEGVITNTEAELQFDYGFLDWSAMPVGGHLCEQFCVQAKYLEALTAAATIHAWLGGPERSQHYRSQAAALRRVLRGRFADAKGGFHHTLRRIRTGCEKYAPGWADDGRVDLGPSGASRHSSACAVFADCVTDEERDALLTAGFDATGQPPIITPMFLYYEQEARARLGAPGEAIARMRYWLADQVCTNDSATIWESFEPEVRDVRKWGLHAWPKSLCHGWGAGLVPLVQRHGLGLENRGPGFAEIRLHQPALQGAFRATVPTPHGSIEIWRDAADAPVRHQVPDGITVLDQGVPA